MTRVLVDQQCSIGHFRNNWPCICLRAVTVYTNMCFAIGQFIGAGILKALVSRLDQWPYRIPFAIQWVWPPFLLIVAVLMPESPWWLVRQGKPEAARGIMERIMAPHERHNADAMVAMMQHTDRLEREISSGTSYLDCFRGCELRRTEIACMVFLAQITCGIQFAYSATYFLEQAGLSANSSYGLNLGGTAISFCGTAASWFLLRFWGRRDLWLSGMLGIVCLSPTHWLPCIVSSPRHELGSSSLLFSLAVNVLRHSRSHRMAHVP